MFKVTGPLLTQLPYNRCIALSYLQVLNTYIPFYGRNYFNRYRNFLVCFTWQKLQKNWTIKLFLTFNSEEIQSFSCAHKVLVYWRNSGVEEKNWWRKSLADLSGSTSSPAGEAVPENVVWKSFVPFHKTAVSQRGQVGFVPGRFC